MAKYEKRLKGNFNEFLRWVDRDIMRGNASISYEDGSDVTIANTRVAVRVYERYSMTGSNRVNLNLTLVGVGEDLFVTAITSGGSQAVLFKINTFGEESFLRTCADSIERYIKKH